MNKNKKYLNELRNRDLIKQADNFEHFPTMPMPGMSKGTVIDSNQTVSPGGGFKATFDINIRRATNNIDLPLQVGILGFAQSVSGYLGIIVPPVGGSVAVTGGTQNNLPDRYRFTYTVGADVDTIDVTCPQIPYPSFLQNSSVDRYRINNIRYFISDGTAQEQFNNLLDFQDSSIFGVKTSNPLTPSSFINPQDEKNNIVDIPVGRGMDKENCIITAISPAVAPFQLNLTFFVEFFDKFTAKSVGL